MLIYCGMSLAWLLLVVATIAIYSAVIKRKPYIGILPDNYYTFTREQRIHYWETGKRWRERLIARAILFVASPTILVGWIIIFIIHFVRISISFVR